MSDHAHAEFNANRIFIILFIATALEVAWGELMPGPNWWVWGGLIAIAFYKGLLIFQYFMHFKFEGPIVKCLIAPTPILVVVLIFALMPDVGSNSRMDYDLTDMADPITGEILEIGHGDDVKGEEHDGDDGH